jgi:hypothetical protein
MGVALEIGKITAVIFLHKNWNAPFLIRTYLIIAIFILMFINSIGIFGYLSKAHISQEILNNTQISQTEVIQSKIDNENSQIKDFDNQISQIDNAITKLTEQGKANTSLAQANSQRKQRDLLTNQKNQHIQAKEYLIKEKIDADNQNAKVASDFGPLLYIADLFFGDATKLQLESTVRWIISIIVFVFDPLALVLLIASQFAFESQKKPLTKPDEKDTFNFDEKVAKF